MRDDYDIAITAFKEELSFLPDFKQQLNTALGGADNYRWWSPLQVSGNLPTLKETARILQHSKVLVLVWSPSYKVQCQAELDLLLRFIHPRRLFILEVLPAERPTELSKLQLQDYHLWATDEAQRNWWLS